MLADGRSGYAPSVQMSDAFSEAPAARAPLPPLPGSGRTAPAQRRHLEAVTDAVAGAEANEPHADDPPNEADGSFHHPSSPSGNAAARAHAAARGDTVSTSGGALSTTTGDVSFARERRGSFSAKTRDVLSRKVVSIKYGHFKGSKSAFSSSRSAVWTLVAIGLATGGSAISFAGFPLADVVAKPDLWWQCLLPCASIWSLISAAMVSMSASVIMVPSEPPLNAGRWLGLSILTSWAMIVSMSGYHLVWTRALGLADPAPWLGGLPGGAALLSCLIGAWWVHSEPWQRASPTERRRWWALFLGLLTFWLSLPFYWFSLLAFRMAADADLQWLVALLLVPTREVTMRIVRHYLRRASVVDEDEDDPTADVLAINLTMAQHTLFLSTSVGSIVSPSLAALQVLCDVGLNLAQALIVVRERRQLDRLVVPEDLSVKRGSSGRGPSEEAAPLREKDADATPHPTGGAPTSVAEHGGSCDATRRRLLALCLGDLPSRADPAFDARLKAKKLRAVRSLLQVVLCETIEVIVPLAYLFTFLCLHYGPNAHALGNVGSSQFLFNANRGVGESTRFLLYFVAADTGSLIIVALVLYVKCRVNVWRVFLFLQEQYGAVLAVQIGWAVNQQFCAIAIGCAIDVSFGHWIDNWASIANGTAAQ